MPDQLETECARRYRAWRAADAAMDSDSARDERDPRFRDAFTRLTNCMDEVIAAPVVTPLDYAIKIVVADDGWLSLWQDALAAQARAHVESAFSAQETASPRPVPTGHPVDMAGERTHA